MERDNRMVFFNVVNLFTGVPRTEAMSEMRHSLEQDHKLSDKIILSGDA
jgi:hypothetical protein